MARHELLDNVVHKDLCVDTRFGAGLGDPAGLVPVWPTEFAELQREYPIFLQKGEGESEYHAVALLGFDASENLFLDGDRWNANYLPGAVAGRSRSASATRKLRLARTRAGRARRHGASARPATARAWRCSCPGRAQPYLDHVITVLMHPRRSGGARCSPRSTGWPAQLVDLDVRFDGPGARVTGLYGIDRTAGRARRAAARAASRGLEGVYRCSATCAASPRSSAGCGPRWRGRGGLSAHGASPPACARSVAAGPTSRRCRTGRRRTGRLGLVDG